MARPFENIKNYKKLFNEYYNPLVNFVYSRYVKNWESAQDIVQSTFLKIWDKRDNIQIKTSVKSYLFQAVKNKSLDYIRDHANHNNMELQDDFRHYDLEDKEYSRDEDSFYIQQLILKSLDILKPKTRKIFELHKFEGLTYAEIAEHLEISKRTVESNMARAFLALKEELKRKL